MRRRRARMPVDPPEINLVPLLDMVSLLIQLMLVNAQFGTFAELPSNAATAGKGYPEGERLTLVVRPTLEGYTVQWREGGPDAPREQRALPCTGACDGPETYDTAGLRALALQLKAAHPNERQVLVSPERGVPFEVIVRTMDELRAGDRPGSPLFPDVLFAGAPR